MDEVRLEGGNVGGAVRVGDTVRRPAGTWTPAVHDLLGFLNKSGLDLIPAVLGCDDQGREILSFLPGRGVDVDAQIVDDSLLAQGAAWLRRFHAIVRDYRPEGVLPWRTGARPLEEDEIICHHDTGAYNWVIDGDQLTGIVDWDVAGPGYPIDDLAFMAWTAVPLFRAIPADDVARRLMIMADTYGAVSGQEILVHADVRMTSASEKIAEGQRRGDPGMLNLATIGEPAATLARLKEFRERLPAILPLLT